MVNKVILVGRVGKDPEFKLTSSTSICNFTLATSKKIKGEEKTAWHRITAFGKKAVFVNEHITKGTQLYVEGELSYGSYENNQGQKVYTTDIIAQNISFAGDKREIGGPSPQHQGMDPHDFDDFGPSPDFDSNEEISF